VALVIVIAVVIAFAVRAKQIKKISEKEKSGEYEYGHAAPQSPGKYNTENAKKMMSSFAN